MLRRHAGIDGALMFVPDRRFGAVTASTANRRTSRASTIKRAAGSPVATHGRGATAVGLVQAKRDHQGGDEIDVAASPSLVLSPGWRRIAPVWRRRNSRRTNGGQRHRIGVEVANRRPPPNHIIHSGFIPLRLHRYRLMAPGHPSHSTDSQPPRAALTANIDPSVTISLLSCLLMLTRGGARMSVAMTRLKAVPLCFREIASPHRSQT
jgi:hypothetical protein